MVLVLLIRPQKSANRDTVLRYLVQIRPQIHQGYQRFSHIYSPTLIGGRLLIQSQRA